MHSRQVNSLNLVETHPQQSPRVLFLHGVLRNWRSYYTVWPALPTEHALAFLDFRGHGDSGRTSTYYVMDYVDDAVSILQALDQPCTVYGHSLGAMVALAAASRVPDRVRSVILEDPPFETMGSRLASSNFMPYFRGIEACMLAQKYAGSEDLFRALSDTIVGTSPQGAAIRLRDVRDEPTRRFMAKALIQVDPRVLAPITSGQWTKGYELATLLESVSCPVRLLQADSKVGGMLTDEDARFIASQLGARCEVTYFPDTGHSIHWLKVPEVVAAIKQVS